MYKKILILVFCSSLLSGCFVAASRSYQGQPQNVSMRQADSLNIDYLKPVSMQVAANKIWQNSGVFVESGDLVKVTASGSWSPAPLLLAWSGPEGNSLWSAEVPGITGGALMARLGHAGHPFEVGISRTFQAKDYGMLYFAMNDPFRYLYDNSGTVTADIYLQGSGGRAEAKQAGGIRIVSYQYDDKTGNGSLAATMGDQAFAVRQYLIKKNR